MHILVNLPMISFVIMPFHFTGKCNLFFRGDRFWNNASQIQWMSTSNLMSDMKSSIDWTETTLKISTTH